MLSESYLVVCVLRLFLSVYSDQNNLCSIPNRHESLVASERSSGQHFSNAAQKSPALQLQQDESELSNKKCYNLTRRRFYCQSTVGPSVTL